MTHTDPVTVVNGGEGFRKQALAQVGDAQRWPFVGHVTDFDRTLIGAICRLSTVAERIQDFVIHEDIGEGTTEALVARLYADGTEGKYTQLIDRGRNETRERCELPDGSALIFGTEDGKTFFWGLGYHASRLVRTQEDREMPFERVWDAKLARPREDER